MEGNRQNLATALARELEQQLQEYEELRALHQLLSKRIAAMATYIESLKAIAFIEDDDKAA